MKSTLSLGPTISVDVSGYTAGSINEIDLETNFPTIFSRGERFPDNDFSYILNLYNNTTGTIAIQSSTSDAVKPSARRIETSQKDKLSGCPPSMKSLFLYVQNASGTVTISIDVVETEV